METIYKGYKIEVSIDPFADEIKGHDGDLYRVDIREKDTGDLIDCDQPYKTEAEALASGKGQIEIIQNYKCK